MQETSPGRMRGEDADTRHGQKAARQPQRREERGVGAQGQDTNGGRLSNPDHKQAAEGNYSLTLTIPFQHSALHPVRPTPLPSTSAPRPPFQVP
jgi:hypothetical protein